MPGSLKFRDPKHTCCTVHHSRPDLCRQYACFRLLILDRQGDHIGRVQDGSRFFSTMNADLRGIWQNEIAGVDIPDEAAWEEHVADVFSRRVRVTRR